MPDVRVRFAPSPTGHLHVGGARTALYNWLFARHQVGVFILRIEDTDVDRSRPELVTAILESLEWLGLKWDEGPYRQSERLDRYREMAAELERRGHAYPCFCAAEELQARRARAEAERRAWKYDGACRKLSDSERQRWRAEGRPSALRFRVPETGETSFDDCVFGRVTVEHRDLEDFVLLRSDGNPTYHLGVVADDLDMRVTHVIRGADHLSNTPKQILMYQALGATAPAFAHLPLILGPDRQRLSKRHGATSVGAYREQGVLPEALLNFLALLGWTPPKGPGGDEAKEILPLEEMVRAFTLEARLQRDEHLGRLDRARRDREALDDLIRVRAEYRPILEGARLAFRAVRDRVTMTAGVPAISAARSCRRALPAVPRPSSASVWSRASRAPR